MNTNEPFSPNGLLSFNFTTSLILPNTFDRFERSERKRIAHMRFNKFVHGHGVNSLLSAAVVGGGVKNVLGKILLRMIMVD